MEECNKEVWVPKEHPDYPGFYHIPGLENFVVNERGVVKITVTTRYKHRGEVLTSRLDKDGYVINYLSDGVNKGRDFRNHVLVALAFYGLAPSMKHQVNHEYGDKADNYYKRLEWCLPKDNIRHGYAMGLIPGPSTNIQTWAYNVYNGNSENAKSQNKLSKLINVPVRVINTSMCKPLPCTESGWIFSIVEIHDWQPLIEEYYKRYPLVVCHDLVTREEFIAVNGTELSKLIELSSVTINKVLREKIYLAKQFIIYHHTDASNKLKEILLTFNINEETIMAQNNNRFKQQAWDIWQLKKLRIIGKAWDQSNQRERPAISVHVVNGNPRFRLYMNRGGAGSCIPIAFDPLIFGQLLEALRDIANNPESTRYTMKVKAQFDKGQRLEKPIVTSNVTVGRDAEGVVFLSVHMRGDTTPAVFEFLPSYFAELTDHAGETLKASKASSFAALSWVNQMNIMVGTFLVVHTTDPEAGKEPRNGGGNGGYNGGGNGGNGGYNNRGGNGGGNGGSNYGGGSKGSDGFDGEDIPF